ncbi:hypothetical protein [Micromonospora sp. NPDC023737]|uniref:hypothetical protein n=1 Tax=unclassified Micromonospora TaxID=2617518 RepID=UPI0033FB1781
MTGTPDIPAHLARRPFHGGLVVPWITPATRGGRYLFGKVADVAQHQCLTSRLCQVCGHRLPERVVLFARESDLGYQCIAEPRRLPQLHQVQRPMLAGRRDRYRTSEHRTLAGIPLTGSQMRRAAPAEPWYAVWVRDYDLIRHPAQPGTLAVSLRRIPTRRIRPVVPA